MILLNIENLYNRSWTPVSFTLKDSIGAFEEKFFFLDNLIQITKKLVADFIFMRVDFYNIGKEIYFGELTLCLGGATVAFNPRDFDEYYGDISYNNKLIREKNK